MTESKKQQQLECSRIARSNDKAFISDVRTASAQDKNLPDDSENPVYFNRNHLIPPLYQQKKLQDPEQNQTSALNGAPSTINSLQMSLQLNNRPFTKPRRSKKLIYIIL